MKSKPLIKMRLDALMFSHDLAISCGEVNTAKALKPLINELRYLLADYEYDS